MVRLRWHEPHARRLPATQPSTRPPPGARRPRATRTTDDDEHRVGMVERGEAMRTATSSPRQRLDTSDEQEHGWSPRSRCGARRRCRARKSVVDARRHDLDPTRRRAVEAFELRSFLSAAREDRVGATDDLDLRAHAALWLLVARLGLHPSQRVERRDERQAELVLEPVPSQPRQPVVRMDDVGAPARFEVVAHLVGELVDRLRERFLRKVGRTDVDVAHPEPRLDRDLGSEAISPRAHVHRAVDARLGQGRDELAHVHVHPARVGNARLGERRGVQREDGEATHGRCQRSWAAADSARIFPRAVSFSFRKDSYTLTRVCFCSSVSSGSRRMALTTSISSASSRIPART